MEWWFFLWAVDYWLPFEMCPPKQQSLPRTIFFLLYAPNITPQQVAWYFVKGRFLWKICWKYHFPLFVGAHPSRNCSYCIPTAQRPTKNDPSSREVFGETSDLAAFQTLVDRFFLGGKGWNIENTWNLEFLSFLFWGDFGAPPQLGSEVVEENNSRCHFEGFVYLAWIFHKKNSHMIYLDM